MANATGAFDGSTVSETSPRVRDAGVDLDAITAELEREGVRVFCDSYRELLDCIEVKAARMAPIPSERV